MNAVGSKEDVPDAAKKRPAISEKIKRAVRQRCRFGCVMCGCPVFQYDHMTPYSEVQCHEESNLTLLCSIHHADKSHGRLSEDLVRHHDAHPCNDKAGYTSPYKIMPDKNISIIIGSNRLIKGFPSGNGDYSCLATTASGEKGSCVVSFATLHAEAGWLSLSMMLTDRQGQPVLSIDHGEIISSSGVWDFHYEGATLKIREKLGSILLDMDFASDRCEIRKGLFLNSSLDGFIVDNAKLTPVVNHRSSLEISGSYCVDGNGGIVIFHEAHFKDPHVPGAPRGFGFCYFVENPLKHKSP